MHYKLIELKNMVSQDAHKGGLCVFEGDKDIPFAIKRFYYIYGVAAGERRGFHAHKTLKQLLFCPYGSIRIYLDDGESREEVLLDRPSRGLLLEPGLWREMEWDADGSVLCVAASDYYTEQDYIRDYMKFKEYVLSLK